MGWGNGAKTQKRKRNERNSLNHCHPPDRSSSLTAAGGTIALRSSTTVVRQCCTRKRVVAQRDGRCTGCGIVGADARPNWAERPERASLIVRAVAVGLTDLIGFGSATWTRPWTNRAVLSPPKASSDRRRFRMLPSPRVCNAVVRPLRDPNPSAAGAVPSSLGTQVRSASRPKLAEWGWPSASPHHQRI